MSTLVIHSHASRYRSTQGPNKRNIAEEANQKAVDDLKSEVQVVSVTASWAENHATIDEIWVIVQQVKEKYDKKCDERTGARASIERLSCRVMYYGKVFDSLAQHHPEYVALAWGAIKLVLMVRRTSCDVPEVH
ncbi:hypothetical protein HBI82_224860 [Parastagonospora nodorum]|nr:hypothetical protein HBI72_084890 [Parastagonospora nodorum]KAH5638016.1 hypothetical protein HBI23_207260 [Parastagonospora nodorum]KAH5983971.1 hypothetical protein HBI82_224860 [Parastagonospora nodorum]